MADQHRPLMTKHGTHCICGVFCASGRNWEAWWCHVADRVELDGIEAVQWNPNSINEEWWTVLEGFRRIGQAYANAGRKLAQAFAPLNQDRFTKIDGGTGT